LLPRRFFGLRVGGHLYGRFCRIPSPPAWRTHRDSRSPEICSSGFAANMRRSLDAPQRPAQPSQRDDLLFLFFAQDIAHVTERNAPPVQCPDSAISLAGFQVSTYGRFWVSPEVPVEEDFFLASSWTAIALTNPPDFSDVRKSLPDFPLLPSLQVFKFEKSTNVGMFFERLRNAISHHRLDFSSESRDLASVSVKMHDKPMAGPVNWEIQISATDLGMLSQYVAGKVIQASW
jgi:hypothetical protein